MKQLLNLVFSVNHLLEVGYNRLFDAPSYNSSYDLQAIKAKETGIALCLIFFWFVFFVVLIFGSTLAIQAIFYHPNVAPNYLDNL